MANSNVNRPYGLIPVSHLDGSPYNGAIQRYYVPASDNTAIYLGDPVRIAGSADSEGTPTATRAAAGESFVGTMVGMEYIPSDLFTQYRQGGVARYIYVAEGKDVVYKIRASAAIAATNIGQNADISLGTGSNTTGISGATLDVSTLGTGTAQLRTLRLLPNWDAEFGSFAEVEVIINENQLSAATGV